MNNENVHQPDYSRLKFLDYVGVRVPNGPPVRMMLFEGNYLVTEEEGTIEVMLSSRLKARKVTEAKYEEIFAQYKQQKLLERQGSVSQEKPSVSNEEELLKTDKSDSPTIKPEFTSAVKKDGTYAEQHPDRPTVMVQRGLTEENDKVLGDVVVNVSRNIGRRSIPTISKEELEGKVACDAPPIPKAPTVRPKSQPKASEMPATMIDERKTLKGPGFETSPEKGITLDPVRMEKEAGQSNADEGFSSIGNINKLAEKAVPPKPPAPPRPPTPPKPPAPSGRPVLTGRSVGAQGAGGKREKPSRTPRTDKNKKESADKSFKTPDHDESVLYDDTPVATKSATEQKKDKSFVVVTSLVSVAIVALLIVATLLLLKTSGVVGRDVDEYNVVVLTGEVMAGQTITEEHISNIVLSKDEYNILTSNTFEVRPGGEAVKEIPVPYERRGEVIGLIAKDNYAAGTIITNRMVSDQRTITNQYFNVVGQNGSQRFEVTIDSETGMTKVTVYAIAPNESGEGVAILIGEATLTDKEFVALLNGDVNVLLDNLTLPEPQEAAEEPETIQNSEGDGGAEGATGDGLGAPGDVSDEESPDGGGGDE